MGALLLPAARNNTPHKSKIDKNKIMSDRFIRFGFIPVSGLEHNKRNSSQLLLHTTAGSYFSILLSFLPGL